MIINQKNSNIEEPHGNTILWRYMSFQKFIDLLINSQLFFSNLSKLTDMYEGTVYNSNLKIEDTKASKNDNYDPFSNFLKKTDLERLKQLTLVNCWTMQRHESYALWKIYGGKEPGVAIRTTVARLKNSINNTKQDIDEDILLAKVKYQNRLDDSFSRIEATITKREFYDFENEIRLIIFNYPQSEGGYQVPYDIATGKKVNIDLSRLIDGIYISPFSNSSYKTNIGKIISKFRPDLSNQIRGSQIQDQ